MPITAPELLRSLGLRVDGPVLWNAEVRSTRPGVYVVELPAPSAHAPVDLGLVGRWLERVPDLLLDGEVPNGRQLAARLSAFWLSGEVILHIGRSDVSLGRRVAEVVATALGDPLPVADAHWLKTLRGLERARVWWAETDAQEEYQDALFGAFADAVDPADAARLPDPAVVLPWADLESPTGTVRVHGITDAFLAAPPAPAPARPVVVLAPEPADSRPEVAGGRAHAVGAGRQRAPRAAAGPAPRAPEREAATPGRAPGRSPRARAPVQSALPARNRAPEPVHVSADGLEKLQAELHELLTVQRPEIISRVKAARELGDLSENADYEAARKEQSFAEGRIRTLEEMIRRSVIIEASVGGDRVVLGSTVVVEAFGETTEYTIVGPTEANPAAGRVSAASPLGQALMGARAGSDVVVHAPRGDATYRVIEIR
jgi:transcription elongation factor GreA